MSVSSDVTKQERYAGLTCPEMRLRCLAGWMIKHEYHVLPGVRFVNCTIRVEGAR
jgi:hypothetical protein